MTFAKKLSASLMAAVMTCSVFCTAAGAVDFTVVDDNTTSTPGNGTVTQTITTGVLQNAIPEFFNGCVKFTWSPVTGASTYVLKLCDTDFKIVRSVIISGNTTAVTVPETAFEVDYNSKKSFYACVVALKANERDPYGTVLYAPSASKFTVEYDMSKYPEFGAAQNITFLSQKGKLNILWKNPNDFAAKKDIFSIEVVDSANKTVFTKEVQDTKVEVTGLKDGQSYKAKIYNKTFSVMAENTFTFVSDVKTQGTTPNDESVKKPQNDSTKKLIAPANFKAKAGNGKVTLTWSKVDDADGYRVYMYNSKTKKYQTYKTVRGTKCTVTGLSNGTSYKFRVAAVRYNTGTKKYVAGTASKTVKATPKKPVKSTK